MLVLWRTWQPVCAAAFTWSTTAASSTIGRRLTSLPHAPPSQQPRPHRPEVTHEEPAEEERLAGIVALDVKRERDQAPPGDELQQGNGQQPATLKDIVAVIIGGRLRSTNLVLDSLFGERYEKLMSHQNVNVCSSAIMTTGGPPVEILAACASVSLPPADAAQACKASSEGKCTSAIR